MKKVFLFLLFIFVSSFTNADNTLHKSVLCAPVLVDFGNGNLGSGFYYRNASYTFFVSAKHVFLPPKTQGFASTSVFLFSYSMDEPSKEILLSLDLTVLNSERNILLHQTKDVIAIRIGNNINNFTQISFSHGIEAKTDPKNLITSITNEASQPFKDVVVGNDTFIFGYPESVCIPLPQILNPKEPLIRKGIIAGKNQVLRKIILDCPVHPGNSGGPAIEIVQDGLTRYYKIIGLVTDFVPYFQEWESVTLKLRNVLAENSGYSVVEPIDSVLEIIN